MKEVKKRKKGNELANAPVKRLIKKANPQSQVQPGSVELLKSELENYATQISRKAGQHATKNKRTTIRTEDIAAAIKEIQTETEKQIIKKIENAGNITLCLHCLSPNTRIINESRLGFQYQCIDCDKTFLKLYTSLYRIQNSKRAFAKLTGGC